jgi:hypothetical protein
MAARLHNDARRSVRVLLARERLARRSASRRQKAFRRASGEKLTAFLELERAIRELFRNRSQSRLELGLCLDD